MLIDIHTHLGYSKVYSDYFINGIIESIENPLKEQMGAAFNKAIVSNIIRGSLNDKDGSKLIKQMDDAGIDKCVLLMTDFGYEDTNMEFSVSEILEVHNQVRIKYPDRVIPFFGIDCRRDVSYVDLFEKSIRDYHFAGLKIYPPCGFDLTDKRLFPYYEICQSYGIPVLSHTGDSLVTMHNDYDYIGQVKDLTKMFKNLQFILAHITFERFEENIRLASELENVYFDLAAFQLDWGKENLTYKVKKIFELIPDKILFGTDWPIYSMLGQQKRWVDYFRNNVEISEENKKKLFYLNAQNVLKI
ncbi:amidohydrolase family protein [Anaeromicropila populeti]|uniref:Amidohydrolase-related domain-containing protein n=1 Tax=Anaeromicropila populeti TaxID=37658 RepID=A0A1I6L174_9FIRM|nr:amidohydrolase family protein [Anaeromicropila populeti]SFR96980.1 hypothetical protein SAMN05661086_02955 [Anaeromicropila populeti]